MNTSDVNAKEIRLKNIDSLRGMCALLVFFQHLIPDFKWLGQGYFSDDKTFYFDIGRLGVSIFFLISGYVIPFSVAKLSKDKSICFCIARFFRLYPAYWFSIGLFVLYFIVDGSISKLSIANILINISMLQRFFGVNDLVGVYWTLQIELVFYLIILFILRFNIKQSSCVYLCLFSIAICMAFLLSIFRYILHVKLPVVLFIALSLMFLGAILRQYIAGDGSKLKINIYIVCFLVLLYPICVLAYGSGVAENDNPYRWFFSYALSVVFFYYFVRFELQLGRYFVFLGSVSYSIYLYHSIFIDYLRRFFDLHSTSGWLLYALFCTVVCITFSYASFLFLEMPFQKIGKKLINKIQK